WLGLWVLATHALSLAQTGLAINPSGTAPHPSALLDLSAPGQGLLVPRMDTQARLNIQAPAQGLLVFDQQTHSFWVHSQQGWLELRSQVSTVADQDADTRLQVEASPDEDVIRLGTSDQALLTLDAQNLNLTGPGLHVSGALDAAASPLNVGQEDATVFAFDPRRGTLNIGQQTGSNQSPQGLLSVVSGGTGNSATGTDAFIGGGRNDTASGAYSMIGGGAYNLVRDTAGVINGGILHKTYETVCTFCPPSGPSFIGGGRGDTVENFATTLGSQAISNEDYTTVISSAESRSPNNNGSISGLGAFVAGSEFTTTGSPHEVILNSSTNDVIEASHNVLINGQGALINAESAVELVNGLVCISCNHVTDESDFPTIWGSGFVQDGISLGPGNYKGLGYGAPTILGARNRIAESPSSGPAVRTILGGTLHLSYGGRSTTLGGKSLRDSSLSAISMGYYSKLPANQSPANFINTDLLWTIGGGTPTNRRSVWSMQKNANTIIGSKHTTPFKLLIQQTGTTGLDIENTSGDDWEFYANNYYQSLQLYMNGSLKGSFDGGSGVYTSTSDVRLKSDIKPLSGTLPVLQSLQPKQYQYLQRQTSAGQIGVLAQELEAS
ncbi:MAG: tail fiber domain-containing protein, partial [Bacteroidota bacterium]